MYTLTVELIKNQTNEIKHIFKSGLSFEQMLIEMVKLPVNYKMVEVLVKLERRN